MATRALQGVTNKLNTSAVDRSLTFSTRKSVNMIFKKKNEEPIKIRSQIIPYKESTQFLGMTLNNTLYWEEHIDEVRAKAKKARNFIKKVTTKSGEEIKKPQKNYTVQYVK